MAARSSSHFVGTGFVLIALMVGVFFLQPLRDEVKILGETLSANQVEYDALQAEIASFVQRESALPQAESEREKLLASVPEGLNQDRIIENLDRIAGTVGISLNSISFSLQNSEADEANTVMISCNFTGQYDDLETLLKALEGNERLFKMESIGVQLGEVNEEGYTMTFSLSLEAYYQE